MKVITDTTDSIKLCHAMYGDLIRSADDGEYYLVTYLGACKDIESVLKTKTEGLWFTADSTSFVNVATGHAKRLNLSSHCYIIKDAEIIARMKP